MRKYRFQLLLLFSLLAFFVIIYFYEPRQITTLTPGTYLNEHNPDNTNRQWASVRCTPDNITPPITGSLMKFTWFSVRILIEHPTYPDYEGIPDTYANPENCIVL